MKQSFNFSNNIINSILVFYEQTFLKFWFLLTELLRETFFYF